MRFQVVGANSESGDDVDVMLEAGTQSEVEQLAHKKGILVASITPLAMAAADSSSIALVEEEPVVAASQAAVAHVGDAHVAVAGAAHADQPVAHTSSEPGAAEKHGMITLSANSPSETGRTSDGQHHDAHKSDAPMEYHILMNQALYLLETAVNKYLKDGWEPQGGLTVGTSNNAMQYFQALSRRKK